MNRLHRWLVQAAMLCGLLSAGLEPVIPAETSPVIALEPVVTGLQSPVYVAHAGDDSGRLFIVEQPGRIRLVKQGRLIDAPFLDIAGRVRFAGEQGLLGLAFHPHYAKNGRFFANYVRASDGHTVIAEFHVSPNADVALSDERVLLTVPQPYPNHKGGMVEFGPDGFLYIALGDGGSGGDPGNRGQGTNELLGKVLRVDVDRGAPYGIPTDNPFVGGGGRPEIFAYGLRNPWRFSFDRQTGELWAADVGQHKWEEIDVIVRGGNYGWKVMEGAHCFAPPDGCVTDGLVPPVAEYGHEEGRCAITGGYVYRGARLPALRGSYFFGDFCSGEIFALSGKMRRALLATGLRIASFGQDQDGELYVVGHGGTVHRIVPAAR